MSSDEIPKPIDPLLAIYLAGRMYPLSDVRAALAEHGLEVTTKDAVDWGTNYPQQARNINQICELTQRRDALEAGVSAEPAPEKKEAAE